MSDRTTTATATTSEAYQDILSDATCLAETILIEHNLWLDKYPYHIKDVCTCGMCGLANKYTTYTSDLSHPLSPKKGENR